MLKNLAAIGKSLAAIATAVTTLAGTAAIAAADPIPSPAAASSPGCAVAAPQPGESTQAFAADGKSGTYIRDVPRGIVGPAPVVLDLHGYLEPAWIQQNESGLGAFGDDHGFVTITPEIDESGLPRWDYGPGSADVAYLSALITRVESTQCVDERRIYVTGLSMGAFTTSSIACELADRVAAVAPVSGVRDYAWCRPSRPVPVVTFHGTGDPILAYNGGEGPVGQLLPKSGLPDAGDTPVPDRVAAWAKRNGCGAQAVSRHISTDVTLSSYPCPAGADVEFYSIVGGGHTWPGSASALFPTAFVGATTHTISADRIMWDFFRAHPLEGRVGS